MPSVPYNAPPTPPIDQAEEGTTGVASREAPTEQPAREPKKPTSERPTTNTNADFGAEEVNVLLAIGDQIVELHPKRVTEAWETWIEMVRIPLALNNISNWLFSIPTTQHKSGRTFGRKQFFPCI
jgi:hypothetical protein